MKRFGSERIKVFLDRMKIDEEDAVIQSKMLSKQVESAQKRVEGNNYDTRKNVLQYDDVMREQREVIYGQRQEVIMEEQDLSQTLMNMVKRSIERVVDSHTQLEESNWNYEGIVDFAGNALVHEDSISVDDIKGKNHKKSKTISINGQKKFSSRKSPIKQSRTIVRI